MFKTFWNAPVTMKKLLLIMACFFLIGAGTGGVLYGDHALIDTYIDIKNSAAPSTSAANQVRQYYDSTKNTMIESYNTNNFFVRCNGGFKNKIINPDFLIDQRGNNASITNVTNYVCDKWQFINSAGGAGTINTTNSITDTVDVSNSASYLGSTIKLATGTTLSVGATDKYYFCQRIEGFNTTSLANRPFSLSVVAKANTSATYCICLTPDSGSHVYVVEMALTTSYQYLTFNIPALAAVNWTNNTTGEGLRVSFILDMGSTNSTATANSWQAGTSVAVSTTNQVHQLTSGTGALTLAYVQLEDGPIATQFEHRSRQQELALCQRYCYVLSGAGTTDIFTIGVVTAATTVNGLIMFPVTMRTTPSFTFNGTNNHLTSGTQGNNNACSSAPATTSAFTNKNGYITFTASADTATTGQAGFAFFNSSSTSADQLIFTADF